METTQKKKKHKQKKIEIISCIPIFYFTPSPFRPSYSMGARQGQASRRGPDRGAAAVLVGGVPQVQAAAILLPILIVQDAVRRLGVPA